VNPAKPATWKFLLGGLILINIAGFALLRSCKLTPTRVLRVAHADPKLQAAIDEARKGLDGFIKELNAPKPGEQFAVKGTFQTEDSPEYIWVRSPVFKDGKFTGKLDQQPIALAGKKKGDEVSFLKKDAVDWLIKDDNGIRGQFTDKALSAVQH
jgi:uncharacterized protein YegJ (DUF2314 family)